MTTKLIVGYRTRLVNEDAISSIMPEIKAPAHYKDEEKIKAYIEEAKGRFLAEAKDYPYMATFDEVYFFDATNMRPKFWTYKGREPGSKKAPICLAVRNWLLTTFPEAWGWDMMDNRKPPSVIFIGFNPRGFLKMLGLECSLPLHKKPLPPKLWYSNSDHRDIEEAVCPKDYKQLSLKIALQARRPLDPQAAALWDENLKDWPGPGADPQKDAVLATELASQLGFLQERDMDIPIKKGKKG